MKNKTEPQVYDNTLKALFGEEAEQIIAYLLPGIEFVGSLHDEERNIEINRSMLKADLVHRIRYKRLLSILNFELQTKEDTGLPLRMLQYHAALYEKHKLPVISAILHLFQNTVQLPPYQLSCADETFVTFYYKIICLWELDAQPIVKNHILSMYTLLPAMQGTTPDLLKQALEEIVRNYSRHQIGSHLLRFHRIMWRSTMMSNQDKREIEEALRMQYHFDEFIDENPVVLERIARSEARAEARGESRGEARGESRGEARGLREAILSFLDVRFSTLAATPQIQQALAHIQDIDKLKQLQRELYLAPDEQSARALLHVPAQE